MKDIINIENLIKMNLILVSQINIFQFLKKN